MKNSVLPFTVVVSACGIIIVWLRHCLLYFYVQNFVNSEKEGNHDVSAAHGRLKRKSTAYFMYTSQQPGLGFKSPWILFAFLARCNSKIS